MRVTAEYGALWHRRDRHVLRAPGLHVLQRPLPLLPDRRRLLLGGSRWGIVTGLGIRPSATVRFLASGLALLGGPLGEAIGLRATLVVLGEFPTVRWIWGSSLRTPLELPPVPQDKLIQAST